MSTKLVVHARLLHIDEHHQMRLAGRMPRLGVLGARTVSNYCDRSSSESDLLSRPSHAEASAPAVEEDVQIPRGERSALRGWLAATSAALAPCSLRWHQHACTGAVRGSRTHKQLIKSATALRIGSEHERTAKQRITPILGSKFERTAAQKLHGQRQRTRPDLGRTTSDARNRQHTFPWQSGRSRTRRAGAVRS